MENQKRTRRDSTDSQTSVTDQTHNKRRNIDFATGQGLLSSEATTSQKMLRSVSDTSTEHHQDNQELLEMDIYLDKKNLSKIYTAKQIEKIRGPAGSSSKYKGESQKGYMHLYLHIQKLRDHSLYDNTTKEEAITAYNAIKLAYESETYNNTLKNRCKELGFPFAQDK